MNIMKLRAISKKCLLMTMTMATMMDIVVGYTTIRPMTFLPPTPPLTFLPPTPPPTQFFTPGPFTAPPRPRTTLEMHATQGVAAPFDLNPYRTTIPPPYSPRTKLVIECPYGFEEISTPCRLPENDPPWPECHATTLHVMHRFSEDGFESCLDAVSTIRDYLGPYADGYETMAVKYPIATVDWLAMVNFTNARLLQNDIANILEDEFNNLWSKGCADFIEFGVTCSLEGDRNDSISTSLSSMECDEEWFFGQPDAFTPVWQNGPFVLFFNGSYVLPTWWNDRTTYDVIVQSYLYDSSYPDKTREFRVCGTRKAMINCAVVLPEEKYSLKDVGNSTVVVYNETEYEDELFEYVSNTSIRICVTHNNFSTVLEQEGEVEEVPTTKTVNVQLIYSHVLLAISTLCLILLIVTYLMFPELRNFQGCAILSFALSLLISQICLQYVAPYARRTTALCQGVAVLAHFTLLCAFAWMTLLAFDLCRSFRVTQTRSHRDPTSRLKRYARHSLVGWGVPLLLVIVALGLHFTENDVLLLEYGSGRNCWVYPVLANIVFFIGPVVLSLVANVILFTITVVNIWRTRKMTRGALQQDRSHKHVISELLIYFKISCLMGFSWLFGLVAALGTTSALWYLFITVNGLQGISVFLSFGVNARVRKLWSKKMTSAGSSTSSGSSNKTKKTSSV
ncbi:adhesion G protein-coupled receptor E2 [Strongylocentrotus purpuratus]|uniref:G-protein coupled receptors family 2 profile 2 domain-containing protein n=1 Tax=Strongylocentrotus purpuratus TaxID=7668 RepID=A0A7M7NN24_STRPU|nr:adhesion G protein-coupled receptor E2 [Strongylocentrotus purpuratus]XP_030838055.1 adhesion G protein-coupled receptor E2 [Strongylocentrotus purpuratus]